MELAAEHNDSLTKFMKDFTAANENVPGFFPRVGEWVTQTVERLQKNKLGEGLPEGFVPATTRFWQVRNDMRGVINLRHPLRTSFAPVLRPLGVLRLSFRAMKTNGAIMEPEQWYEPTRRLRLIKLGKPSPPQ